MSELDESASTSVGSEQPEPLQPAAYRLPCCKNIGLQRDVSDTCLNFGAFCFLGIICSAKPANTEHSRRFFFELAMLRVEVPNPHPHQTTTSLLVPQQGRGQPEKKKHKNYIRITSY